MYNSNFDKQNKKKSLLFFNNSFPYNNNTKEKQCQSLEREDGRKNFHAHCITEPPPLLLFETKNPQKINENGKFFLFLCARGIVLA